MAPTQNSPPTARPQALPLDLTPPARGYFTIDTPSAFAPRGLTPTALEGTAPFIVPFRLPTREFSLTTSRRTPPSTTTTSVSQNFTRQASRGYSPGAVPLRPLRQLVRRAPDLDHDGRPLLPFQQGPMTPYSRRRHQTHQSAVARPAQHPRSSRREEHLVDCDHDHCHDQCHDHQGRHETKSTANNWYDQLVGQEAERKDAERKWLADSEPREGSGSICARSNVCFQQDAMRSVVDTGAVLRANYRISQEERAAGTFVALFRKYQDGLEKKRKREAVQEDVEKAGRNKLRRTSPSSACIDEECRMSHMRKPLRRRIT